MIVTENGLGAYDKLTEDGKVHDDYRIEYLRKHIEQIKLAADEGAEMMGYCPWSAIDLVSTHEGITKRYGFIYVNRDEFDMKDLARYRKDSFYWYKKVIETNGEDLSIKLSRNQQFRPKRYKVPESCIFWAIFRLFRIKLS